VTALDVTASASDGVQVRIPSQLVVDIVMLTMQRCGGPTAGFKP
jgi:hypothetical protein